MSRFDDFLPGADETGTPSAVHAPRDLDHGRALGALMGLAVGDALGTTLEFTRPAVPALPTLLTGPHREVLGGGPFSVAPGQVTDDTQLATALARSLMERGGFDLGAVAEAYVAWSRIAFDIGHQTRATLARIGDGEAPLAAGRAVWQVPRRRPAGNGSLMRTVPVALFYAHDADRRREVAMLESGITHFDPRCRLACAAFDAAVAMAVTDPAAGAEAMGEAAEAELALAAAKLHGDHPDDGVLIDTAEQALARDLEAARAANPELDGPEVDLARMAGFVRVAFRLAFWHLHHTRDFEAALVDVVNRGADADTNGAIVGSLLGARDGVDAIPARWSEAASDALDGASGPWADDYHPRRLFSLLSPPRRGRSSRRR